VDADLVAVSIVPAVTSLEAGESLALSLSVLNEGPDAVPGFRVGAYLSADDQFDAGDPRLGTWTQAGLDPDELFQTSGTVQVPVATVDGGYHLLVFADDLEELDENSEDNNIVLSSVLLNVAPPSHPDLVVESVGFSPTSVEAGQTITVSDVVRNDGVEASGSFRVGIYLSADALITTADLLIGQRSVSSLAVGSSASGSGSMTVPLFISAGNYFVGAVVDDLDAIVEMDETNNGQASNGTLSVAAAPLPDLAPSGISFTPLTVDAGQPITAEESVLNQGAAASPLFQVGVFLSDDATIDPTDDILIGTRSISTLGVGSSSASGPTSVTIPSNTPGGEYFVGVFADSAVLVPETDEGNNGLVAANRVTVTVPPLPDLVATSFSFSPSIVAAGGTGSLSISDDVVNMGVADSAAVRVAVYLSTDASVTTNDILLGTHDLQALSVGAGAGASVDLPVPGGIAAGSYRVGLWVDDDQQQPEIDEGNNLIVSTTFLDVTGGGAAAPNLVSELIDPDDRIVAPGEGFQVVTRVANVGDASTPLFRIGVYLSTDNVIEPTDTRIGDRLVPFGLGAGFVSVASAPANVPANLADGFYTLGVLADWQGVVAESDETDNALNATGTFEVRTPPPPRPELVVGSVDVVETGPFTAGQTLQVAHTLRNDGTVDAAAFRVGFYLSDDDAIDTTDTLIGSRTLSSLLAGATDSTTTSVQIPASTTAGSWFIGAFVDDLGAVDENAEGDNGTADPDTFTVQ
jgi:subtilase family serine protease